MNANIESALALDQDNMKINIGTNRPRSHLDTVKKREENLWKEKKASKKTLLLFKQIENEIIKKNKRKRKTNAGVEYRLMQLLLNNKQIRLKNGFRLQSTIIRYYFFFALLSFINET